MNDFRKIRPEKPTEAHLAPHWLSAGIAAAALLVGVVMTVRADDLSQLNAKIASNSQQIGNLQRQVDTVMTSEAVLLQKETDLVDLFNRYLQGHP